MKTKCPACQSDLDFEPWASSSPSFEICPACGIQFGYNDAREDLRPGVYVYWREAWLSNDRRALTGKDWKETSVRVTELAIAALGPKMPIQPPQTTTGSSAPDRV